MSHIYIYIYVTSFQSKNYWNKLHSIYYIRTFLLDKYNVSQNFTCNYCAKIQHNWRWSKYKNLSNTTASECKRLELITLHFLEYNKNVSLSFPQNIHIAKFWTRLYNRKPTCYPSFIYKAATYITQWVSVTSPKNLHSHYSYLYESHRHVVSKNEPPRCLNWTSQA